MNIICKIEGCGWKIDTDYHSDIEIAKRVKEHRELHTNQK